MPKPKKPKIAVAPFERFAMMARKIARVPKDEADKRDKRKS